MFKKLLYRLMRSILTAPLTRLAAAIDQQAEAVGRSPTKALSENGRKRLAGK